MRGIIFAFMLAQATSRRIIIDWPELRPFMQPLPTALPHITDPQTEVVELSSVDSGAKYSTWIHFVPEPEKAYVIATNTPYQNALFENPLLEPELRRKGWTDIHHKDIPACVLHYLFQPTMALQSYTHRSLGIIQEARRKGLLIVAMHIRSGGKRIDHLAQHQVERENTDASNYRSGNKDRS